MKKRIQQTCLIISMLMSAMILPATGSYASPAKDRVYLDQQAFLSQAFNGQVPSSATIWIKGSLKTAISAILGHDYPALRIRYWRRDRRLAWILEEIGKEKPITAGFVIDDGRIAMTRVLVFRESRGHEIRYPAFTRQFEGAGLDADGQLDRGIDGISGATLSVNAMRKLAAVALLLTQHVLSGEEKR